MQRPRVHVSTVSAATVMSCCCLHKPSTGRQAAGWVPTQVCCQLDVLLVVVPEVAAAANLLPLDDH